MLTTIINDLGGITAVAAATGAAQSTVSCWIRRRSIPVRHWPALLRIAGERGVALDERRLLAAHGPADAEAA